jgi:hypothetical protein
MLLKVLLGLFEGALIGGIVSFGFLRFHAAWSPGIAYAAAAVVGALVGTVAGKPIWAREAKLEGLLKSLAGAFIAITAMYGARKWLSGIHVNLDALGGGAGPIGEVPAAALPLIGAGLGFVFQIDDASGGDAAPPRQRVETTPPAREVGADGEETEHAEQRARGEH